MKCDSSRGPARNAFPLPSMLMLIINAFCAGSSSTAITPHMNLKGPAQNALMMHISIDGKWKYIIPNNFLMIAIYTNKTEALSHGKFRGDTNAGTIESI